MWDKVIFSNWEIIYRTSSSYVNIENHEHQDYLHFIVNYLGYPVLVDSGLASYMKDHMHANARNAEYHNSILIDGHPYSPTKEKIFPDEYYVTHNSSAKTKTKTGYKVILKTSGFNRIDSAINFERHLIIDDKSLIIIDNSKSVLDHKIENFFHFDNNLRFLNNPRYFKFNVNDSMIEFVNYGDELLNSSLNIYSKKYGHTQRKKVLNSINIINSSNPIIHKLNIT